MSQENLKRQKAEKSKLNFILIYISEPFLISVSGFKNWSDTNWCQKKDCRCSTEKSQFYWNILILSLGKTGTILHCVILSWIKHFGPLHWIVIFHFRSLNIKPHLPMMAHCPTGNALWGLCFPFFSVGRILQLGYSSHKIHSLVEMFWNILLCKELHCSFLPHLGVGTNAELFGFPVKQKSHFVLISSHKPASLPLKAVEIISHDKCRHTHWCTELLPPPSNTFHHQSPRSGQHPTAKRKQWAGPTLPMANTHTIRALKAGGCWKCIFFNLGNFRPRLQLKITIESGLNVQL